MSNERHPGSERGLRSVCPPLRYVNSGAKLAQKMPVPGLYITDIPVLPEFRVLGGQIWPTDIPFLRARNPKSRVSVAKIWRFFGALAVIY